MSKLIVTTEDELRRAIREEVAAAMGQKSESFRAYVTGAEVAKHFGVSRAAVHRWVQRGCPHLRCGGALRYEMTAVGAWLRSTQEQ